MSNMSIVIGLPITIVGISSESISTSLSVLVLRSRFGAVTVTVAGSPEFQKSSLVMAMSVDSSLTISVASSPA